MGVDDRGGLERAEERLRVLTHAMRTFAGATTDYAQLLDAIARKVAEVIGDSCTVFELDDSGDRLVPCAVHAIDTETLSRMHALLDSEPFLLEEHATARRVIETRESLLIPHIDASHLPIDTSNAYVAFQKEQKIHSLLAVALQRRKPPSLRIESSRPSATPLRTTSAARSAR